MSILIRSLFLSLALLVMPLAAKADTYVSVRIGPPALPVYEQPWAPGPGYYWIPGYWAWDAWYEDYYWVPGYWTRPPRVGWYWTPGYWAWNTGFYVWYPGYWGPRVGFYGGIAYGFGYTGHGYHGGYWRDGHFWHNSYVNRVRGDAARYSYRTPVVNNITVNRVSYNGGDGGTSARPSREEQEFRRQRPAELTDEQRQHERAARDDRGLRYSVNNGRPATFAVPTPAKPRSADDRRQERDAERFRDERESRGTRSDSPRVDDERLDRREPRQRQRDAGDDDTSPTVIRGTQIQRPRDDRERRQERAPERLAPPADERSSRDFDSSPYAGGSRVQRIDARDARMTSTRPMRGDPRVEVYAPSPPASREVRAEPRLERPMREAMPAERRAPARRDDAPAAQAMSPRNGAPRNEVNAARQASRQAERETRREARESERGQR